MTHFNKTRRLSQLELAILRVVHYTKFPVLMDVCLTQKRLSEEEDIDATLTELVRLMKGLQNTGYLRSAEIMVKYDEHTIKKVRIYRISNWGGVALKRDDLKPIMPRKEAS